ncbi:hypothetical protein A3J19_04195 [Candidatus Daviesbacteria bacterium RIFCSPLOWO2_02_FULL_41_8]|uniref:Copper amine oxidase-like N-terminal domain-containing protein n=3 Tax=Candidatus Daviesiibacteriota TaxID=1752718 RepID=A0A1F5NLT8_9BACT|nr:MAG: hypothetical protein A2871_01685 [Candidatus Daviesbacteria bacterium RIFCSPHIGHO2_01_FULL_41_23]OGE33753.1 MAG: hypothetical protein A3D83_00135 [Candidatus Daviesbacteria bacterium RIFCSPHIGHO2_02_FULL_41_10]OGE62204.1 MAG: hypothetical protein A2967_00780 [Candidatus Daviesbacteria bacterium RIFCSPLOWO2_01_FULL_41_32]OGE78667.1 MAG: hypothetical protein A3J19_04195 [Candidatus Daviesbacteria bacterium RIFCSPLOWO2_02_FULL_41_8]
MPASPAPETILNTTIDKKETVLTKFTSEADFKSYLSEGNNRSTSGAYFGSSVLENRIRAVPGANIGAVMETQSLPQAGGGAPERVSETNVQVKGIDEPDILKTDGKSLFFSSENQYYPAPAVRIMGNTSVIPPYELPQGRLKIINSLPADKMAVLGNIEKNGQMLLVKDILVVFTDRAIFGFDVKDPASPKEIWKIDLDSQSQLTTARLFQDKIYLITQTGINSSRPCPLTPLTSGQTPLSINCAEIYHPSTIIPADVTYTASIINPGDGKVEKFTSVVGSSGSTIIYMSNKAIYISYTYEIDQIKLMYGFFNEKGKDLISAEVLKKLAELQNLDISNQAKLTELMVILERFYSSLDENERLKMQNEMTNRMKDYSKEHLREFEKTGIAKIGLDDIKITATGVVPGRLLNQFSLDEHNGYLRVATTVGGGVFNSSDSANDIYTLDNNLNISGSVLNLGKGERVYSARFLGDKGYIVTFKQTDPFYVLDLSNPKSPQVKGELKIPGYSSYLHPLSPNRILGVGKEGSQVKLSLFDVTVAESPAEIDKYILDEYWSEALSTHHAFLQDGKHKVLFIPGNKGGYIISYEGDKFVLKKAISETMAKRAVYINDYLYIVGEDKIVVVDEKTWEIAGTLTF